MLFRLASLFILLATSAALAKNPNIVYILLDDLDYLVSDPFLDKVMPYTMGLARKGASFKKNYSGVICCESRAAILTGLHAHNNGVFTNGGPYGGYAAFRTPKNPAGAPMNIDNETRTFAKILSDRGYRTALVGKYMNGFDPQDGNLPKKPLGWTDGVVAIGNGIYLGYQYDLMLWENNGKASSRHHGIGAINYATDVLKRDAIRLLRRFHTAPEKKPFLLYLAPTAPHLPIGPRADDAPWTGSVPSDRPNFFEDGGWEDKPNWLQLSLPKRNTEKMREWVDVDWKRRLGSLYAVDEMIEDISKVLAAQGELEDTVFLLTSDNGYNLGAHALIHKMAPYEESMKVPLYVWGGKNLGIGESSIENFTLHIDHAPTILELAEVSSPSEMDGVSLVPFLKGQTPSQWRNDFLQQYDGGEAGNGIGFELPENLEDIIDYVKMPGFLLDIPDNKSLNARFRSQHFVYIEWNSTLGRDRELYELSSDRFQLNNLLKSDNEICQSVAQAMKARLAAQAACRGKSCNQGSTAWPPGTALCGVRRR